MDQARQSLWGLTTTAASKSRMIKARIRQHEGRTKFWWMVSRFRTVASTPRLGSFFSFMLRRAPERANVKLEADWCGQKLGNYWRQRVQ